MGAQVGRGVLVIVHGCGALLAGAASRFAEAPQLSKGSPAVGPAAPAAELPIVVGVSVPAGKFLPSGDGTQRIEFDVAAEDPHKGVRGARVVDVPESVSPDRGVDSVSVVGFYNGKPSFLPGASAGLPLRDALPGVFPDLRPGRDRGPGKETLSVNRALSDPQAAGECVGTRSA